MSTFRPARARQEGNSTSWHFSEPHRPAGRRKTQGLPPVSAACAMDLPPYRVSLEDWCRWTGASWDKISAVVGHAFRVPGPAQSVYTMAANAALKLLRQNDVDPARIGLLALGTESSNDNSAGSIIIKGMLDQALDDHGLPRLSQHCEVPEIKHACLGGVYALKNAVRHCFARGFRGDRDLFRPGPLRAGQLRRAHPGGRRRGAAGGAQPGPCQPGPGARGTRLGLPDLRFPQAADGRGPATALQPSLPGVQWSVLYLLLPGPGPQRAVAPVPAPGACRRRSGCRDCGPFSFTVRTGACRKAPLRWCDCAQRR